MPSHFENQEVTSRLGRAAINGSSTIAGSSGTLQVETRPVAMALGWALALVIGAAALGAAAAAVVSKIQGVLVASSFSACGGHKRACAGLCLLVQAGGLVSACRKRVGLSQARAVLSQADKRACDYICDLRRRRGWPPLPRALLLVLLLEACCCCRARVVRGHRLCAPPPGPASAARTPGCVCHRGRRRRSWVGDPPRTERGTLFLVCSTT